MTNEPWRIYFTWLGAEAERLWIEQQNGDDMEIEFEADFEIEGGDDE